MLLYIIYKSSLWKNKTLNNRLFRTFVAGIIFYSLLYTFLNSKYVKDIEVIVKNKRYIYYLVVIDSLLTFYSNAVKKTKNKKEIEKFSHQIPMYKDQQLNDYYYDQQHYYQQQPLQEVQQIEQGHNLGGQIYEWQGHNLGGQIQEEPIQQQSTPELIKIDTRSDNSIIDDQSSFESIPVYKHEETEIPLYVSKNSS